MSDFDEYEFVDACIHELDRREASPPNEYWLFGDSEIDEAEGYCFDCVRIRLYEEMYHAKGYTHAYPTGESDGVKACDRCGLLLDYVLTEHGVIEEMGHFLENGWDWNNANDCFELARVADGMYGDKQRKTFLKVLLKGANRPTTLELIERPAS